MDLGRCEISPLRTIEPRRLRRSRARRLADAVRLQAMIPVPTAPWAHYIGDTSAWIGAAIATDPRQIIVEHAEWLQLVDGPTAQLLDHKCRHRASNEPAPVRNREVILPGHRVKASASENELLQRLVPRLDRRDAFTWPAFGSQRRSAAEPGVATLAVFAAMETQSRPRCPVGAHRPGLLDTRNGSPSVAPRSVHRIPRHRRGATRSWWSR